MMSKNKKDQRKRKELRKMLADAYERPAYDPDFTRRIMRKCRYSRPDPFLLRLCNKATVFFCSPIWIFIALAIGIGLLQDKIVTIITNIYDRQFSCSPQGMQSILVLGGLICLIFFACKEMIHETDN